MVDTFRALSTCHPTSVNTLTPRRILVALEVWNQAGGKTQSHSRCTRGGKNSISALVVKAPKHRFPFVFQFQDWLKSYGLGDENSYKKRPKCHAAPYRCAHYSGASCTSGSSDAIWLLIAYATKIKKLRIVVPLLTEKQASRPKLGVACVRSVCAKYRTVDGSQCIHLRAQVTQ